MRYMRNEVLLTYSEEEDPFIKRTTIAAIEYLFGRYKLQKLYNNAINKSNNGASFWDSALENLNIKVNFNKIGLEQFPKQGPVLVIANHPFGVLDGIMICYLVSKVRNDFKVMLHKTLCREETIAKHILPIDFQETKKAILTNINSKKRAKEYLKSGGVVIIFPAGGVSTASNIFGKAKEFKWKPFPARLAKETNATIVPLYFHGQNSWLFHGVSKVSEAIRSAMHVREVKNKMGKEFKVSIGNPIKFEELARINNRMELTKTLYDITHKLNS